MAPGTPTSATTTLRPFAKFVISPPLTFSTRAAMQGIAAYPGTYERLLGFE